MLKFKSIKEKSNKIESKTSKSISLGKNITKFQNSKRKENEDKKKNDFSKFKNSLKNNVDKKIINTDKNIEIENPKIKKENKQFSKNKKQFEYKKAKFNTRNSKSKENKQSKNLVLSKNSTKENKKKNKNQTISPQRNKKKEISKKKSNYQLGNIEKIIFTIDDFETINKNKDTLSTNYETNSNRENKFHSKPKKKIIKAKNRNKIDDISQKKKNKNIFQKEIINKKNNDKSKEDKIKRREKRLATVLTPIPLKIIKKDGNQIQFNEKDVQNAIVLRRLEYNEYITTLNMPKPKPKPNPKPTPKPKIYDINKVNVIQKIYKGFQTRDIQQIVNRLKVNLCANELFCLILNEVYIHAKKRIIFNLLKLFYHEPFHSIYNEVDFTDRIYMKLSGRYYNFNNIIEEFY